MKVSSARRSTATKIVVQLLGVAAEITTNDTQEFFRDMLRIIMS